MAESTTLDARTRFSIDLNERHRDALAAIAKSYKITQGEVIEVLLDRADTTGDHLLGAALMAKRTSKVARRAPKKELYKQFKNLTPEQLQVALEAAQKLQIGQ